MNTVEIKQFSKNQQIHVRFEEVQEFIAQLELRGTVPPRDLLTNACIYMPRLANEEGLVSISSATNEVHRLERMLESRIARYKHWLQLPTADRLTLAEMSFEQMPEDQARIVLEKFHYLSSFRDQSLHFGLRFTKDTPCWSAMVTVSPFDLDHLTSYLPYGIQAKEARVVSRIYAFPWSPPNSISFMLGRLSQYLTCGETQRPKILLTYVNPNLGFTGASYEASNWVYFAREENTRYSYLDGYYVTDRVLESKFGTANPTKLKCIYGKRFESTTMPLQALDLYAYFLEKATRIRNSNAFSRITVNRPS